jgi:NAD+--asparagine ADP-ribosyltransferase
MFSLHRPTLRECIRAVTVGIVIVFAVCAVSIAYAAGKHSSRVESQQGAVAAFSAFSAFSAPDGDAR